MDLFLNSRMVIHLVFLVNMSTECFIKFHSFVNIREPEYLAKYGSNPGSVTYSLSTQSFKQFLKINYAGIRFKVFTFILEVKNMWDLVFYLKTLFYLCNNLFCTRQFVLEP